MKNVLGCFTETTHHLIGRSSLAYDRTTKFKSSKKSYYFIIIFLCVHIWDELYF